MLPNSEPTKQQTWTWHLNGGEWFVVVDEDNGHSVLVTYVEIHCENDSWTATMEGRRLRKDGKENAQIIRHRLYAPAAEAQIIAEFLARRAGT